MCKNRSSRQNGCCRSCGNGCGNCSDWTFNPYWVTYQRRFLNVPMRVFNGAGYSSQDALESIADALHTISDNDSDNNCGTRNNGCGDASRGGWARERSGNDCQDWRNSDNRNDCTYRSSYRSGCGCC